VHNAFGVRLIAAFLIGDALSLAKENGDESPPSKNAAILHHSSTILSSADRRNTGHLGVGAKHGVEGDVLGIHGEHHLPQEAGQRGDHHRQPIAQLGDRRSLGKLDMEGILAGGLPGHGK
jgi:hypothetical protein